MYTNGPKIVTDGLVLALDAGNTKSYPGSGTTWNDLSGNNYSGSLTNGPTFDSANGGNIVFDGTNDYIETNASGVVNLTEGTVCCWCRYDTITTNRVAVSYGGNDIDNGWLLQNEGSRKIEFGTFRTSGTATLGAANSTQYIGQWIYQVGTYNLTSTKLYINGVLVNSVVSSGSIPAATTLWIGGETGRSFYLDGNVAIVKYYNRTLTAEEVLQNYNATRGRYGV
jgi:hypothetical protein